MGQLASRISYRLPLIQPMLQYFMTPDDILTLDLQRALYQWCQGMNNNNSTVNGDKDDTEDFVLSVVAMNNTSPYSGMFDNEEDDETRMGCQQYDENDDDDDTDDDDDDDCIDDAGVHDESRGGRGGAFEKGREQRHRSTLINCRYCQKAIQRNDDFNVYCAKCQSRSEIYCSPKCLQLGRTRHEGICANIVQFRAVEDIIRACNPNDNFGCLDDLPGLEHKLLGGSKVSVVLKIEREISWSQGIFHCKDREGQRSKIKFKAVHSPLIRLAIQQHRHIYLPVLSAWLQPLHHQAGRKGSPVNANDIGLMFEPANDLLLIVYTYDYVDGRQQEGTGEVRPCVGMLLLPVLNVLAC